MPPGRGLEGPLGGIVLSWVWYPATECEIDMEPGATPLPHQTGPQAAEEPSGPDGSARQEGSRRRTGSLACSRSCLLAGERMAGNGPLSSPATSSPEWESLQGAIVTLGAPNDHAAQVLPFPQERRGPRSCGDGRSLPRARPSPSAGLAPVERLIRCPLRYSPEGPAELVRPRDTAWFCGSDHPVRCCNGPAWIRTRLQIGYLLRLR